MKRQITGFLLALIFLVLPLVSLAWGPERFYDSLEELPPEVRDALHSRMQPGETFLTAHLNGSIPVLTDMPDGRRKLYIFEDGGPNFALIFERHALPVYRGIKPGILSDADSITLKYGDEAYFTFQNFGLDWLLGFVHNQDQFTVKALMIELHNEGDQAAAIDQLPDYGLYTAQRSLHTITEADLPISYRHALSNLDPAALAVVSNPNPSDRLHLRAKPDREADSLGKFYSGTPVVIQSIQGDWAYVRIGRLDGYMMRKFLAFNEQMIRVKPAFLDWRPREDALPITPYTRPDTKSPILGLEWGSFWAATIIGVVGENWLILMNDAGNVCYVLRETFSPGNG
ncbi:MAG: SH3 domain-containing protein [Clostridiales bacterium]|nr:SH3 domain-containing protein [Clostridiales bacterium]